MSIVESVFAFFVVCLAIPTLLAVAVLMKHPKVFFSFMSEIVDLVPTWKQREAKKYARLERKLLGRGKFGAAEKAAEAKKEWDRK